MKSIDELEISTTPWRFTKVLPELGDNLNAIKDAHGYNVTEGFEADARIMAAAPDLYKALYDIVKACEGGIFFGEAQDRYDAAVKALAKASGEE